MVLLMRAIPVKSQQKQYKELEAVEEAISTAKNALVQSLNAEQERDFRLLRMLDTCRQHQSLLFSLRHGKRQAHSTAVH